MIRGLAGLIAAVALAGATAAFAQTAPDPIPGLTVKPLLLPKNLGRQVKLGSLEYRGGVTIGSTADPTVFHGFSGLWVSPDGKTLAAVEHGKWITAELRYDQRGDLAGFALKDSGPLLDEKGKPFSDDEDMDSEALDFDGQHFLVGFETHGRVLAYDEFKAAAQPITLPDEAVGKKGGFSSVVALEGGGTLFLPEYTYENHKKKKLTATARPRGWLRTASGAEGPIWLRAAFPWMPVSLAQLPDGDLLVLELHLVPNVGVDQARLSRIARADVKIGHTMRAHRIAMFGMPMPAWRIEGTSVRKGPNGETLLYMMTSTAPAQLYMFELKHKAR